MDQKDFSISHTLEKGAFYFTHKANHVTENVLHTSPHSHDQYEIYWFREGNIKCTVEGNIYDIAPDDFLITNTRELHRPLVTAPCFYRRKRILISPSFLAPFFTHNYSPLAFFDNRILGTCNKISHAYAREHGLITLFEKIEQNILSDAPQREVMVKVYLMELLHGMSELVASTTPKSYPSKDIASEVLLYINNHIESDLSYEALGRRFHTSPKSLYRLFMQNTGFAPGEYIQGRRIVKAKGLLNSGMPARTVAEQVGFTEYSTFYRAFLKHTGIAPAKFAKNSDL